jgi:phosphoribosylformylglycinamidine cyclo-ligase
MSKDDPPLLERIIEGITAGCLESDCALLGGETAIHPGQYAPGEYDLAGFCVGVVQRKDVIDGSAIVPGDLVIGLASTGLHSNGFSLVRKVVLEMAGLSVDDHVEELGTTVGQALLEPTRIYARAVRSVLGHYRVKKVVHGIAHVTGGGLPENVERILPDGAQVVINRGSWPVPPVFTWLERLGGIEAPEMYRVFNMGVGLVLIVSEFFAQSIRHQLARQGVKSWSIGRVEAGPRGVVWGETGG